MRLATEDLVVRYPARDVPALDGVTMSVQPGSLYSVIGPNGSGKSTLMRALLGVAKAEAGMAAIDGRAVGRWKRAELARAVGAVAQAEAIAFPITVRELVGLGRYPHLGALSLPTAADRSAVERALDACDLLDLAERDATTLSGGEFQRARIARALAQEPSALVLDEPTASLDIRHQMGILELLRASADRGMTVLLITHSLDLAAQYSDAILLLSEGRVAAEGTAHEVMRDDVLSSVYGWPITVRNDPSSDSLRVTPRRSGARGQPPGRGQR